MIKFIFTLTLLKLIQGYLETQLIRVQKEGQLEHCISLEIQKTKYKLAIHLNHSQQYLNPPKNTKSPKQSKQTTGILEGHSMEENNNIEGWRRYLSQALFFIEQRYHHKFQLELNWMEINHNTSSPSDGAISLSPSIVNSRFFNQVKKDYPHITDDVFSIYMGVSDSKNMIQFGGYETKYAYQTIVGQFHKVQIQDDESRWTIRVPKLIFSKDDHGKYADYVLNPEPIGLTLSLSHSKFIITQNIVKVLLIALESERISCKFSKKLECSNMSSLDISLHQFVFPVNSDFSVNISLYRLLDECDKKLQHCSFNVQIGNYFEMGQAFFKDHYTVFNMNQKSILIGLNNKYPSEWFSTVYIIRIGILLFILMIVTALVVDSPRYLSFLRQRKDDVEGIQLVSNQQLHQF